MRRALVLPFVLLTGCVYYNAMYNARKFSHDAEKAEREGRTIDANTAWGQVTVKAETLLARHPTSKYVPEAQVLMGRAFAELGDCVSARAPLETGLAVLADSSLRRAGQLALARCYERLDQPARAATLLQALYADAPDSGRRELRAELVRALRLAGRYDAGLAVVASSPDELGGERMALLAGAGRMAEAEALADSLAIRSDTAAPWDSAAALAGRADPEAGRRIVDAMLRLPGTRPSTRAEWLLADARRLSQTDTSAALERYRQVDTLKASSDLLARAQFEQVVLRLAHAQTPAELDSQAAALQRLSDDSPLAFDARVLLATVHRIIGVRDSVSSDTPSGDLRFFLAAEAARDSLHAPALAEWMFRRMADVWPSSPYAAKALLAVRLLAPADSSLRIRIDSAYAESPYVLALRGEDPPALRSLEDSLGAFAQQEARQSARPSQAPRRRAPAGTQPRPAPGQRAPEVR